MDQTFTIAESRGRFSMYVKFEYMLYKSPILVDESVAGYLVENYNAKIGDKVNDTFYIYFDTNQEAELALEWIESFYVTQRLAGEL